MNVTENTPSRSYGLKLIIVCALVLLMAIPAMFISYVSFERSSRANDVTSEVSARYGGHQTVTGPIVSVPYALTGRLNTIVETGDYIFFSEDGSAKFSKVETDIKKRSLFKVPIYQASGDLTARFSPDNFKVDNERLNLDWSKARVLVGITNGRGLKQDLRLQVAGKTHKFEPGFVTAGPAFIPEGAKMAASVIHVPRVIEGHGLQFLSVSAGDFISPERAVDLEVSILIGGAGKLSIFPFAKSTKISMASDWASPGFFGQFPPLEHDVSEDGFTANWSIPFLARGIPAHGTGRQVLRSMSDTVSVSFISEFSAYQTVNRALKYSVMFIGLVFITFFLIEVILGRRVHPAQYILIGLAQSIFYLLLLAFAEHIGFTAGFMIAALATIILTAVYAGWTFGDRKYAYRAGAVFSLTYGLLFSLMRMQDFALMIGALASFIAITLVMYLTRNMDWYGVSETLTRSPAVQPSSKN